MSALRILVDVYCLPWGLIALWPAWELLRQSAAEICQSEADLLGTGEP